MIAVASRMRIVLQKRKKSKKKRTGWMVLG
jgi:hypothetical protein